MLSIHTDGVETEPDLLRPKLTLRAVSSPPTLRCPQHQSPTMSVVTARTLVSSTVMVAPAVITAFARVLAHDSLVHNSDVQANLADVHTTRNVQIPLVDATLHRALPRKIRPESFGIVYNPTAEVTTSIRLNYCSCCCCASCIFPACAMFAQLLFDCQCSSHTKKS